MEGMPPVERRADLLGAAFVFVVTQIVYLLTMTLDCPFWDSGEFIATSYTLGIPHPPGTPLYVLIGRVMTLLPVFDLVATRVNYLSALASSLTAVFVYLGTVEFYRAWFRRPGTGDNTDETAPRPLGVIGFMAGATAAFFTAFGRTFWDNAIEAEVYALSSLIMALSVWLILRWARPGTDRVHRTGLFVLLYYLICLSMGIHLGTFLVLPGIMFFAYVVDHRIFGRSYVTAAVVAGVLVLLHPGMLPTLKLGVWLPLLVGVVLAAAFARNWSAAGSRGLITWCAIAAVLGISTHLFLKIRAGLDPAINEADPETWDALWKMLIRDQYKPANPFVERQAPWAIQFTRHFWDYARDQYRVGFLPEALGLFLPYAIGVIGAIGQGLREKKTFLLMLGIYLITSVGLVFYLNFRENEVRPRDYFFVASFQFFAVWIGLGVAFLLEEIRGLWGGAGRSAGAGIGVRTAVAAIGALFLVLPAGTAAHYWFSHDRTGFHVARDFAYNILTPLGENAILFTNGDNDTFPLWYLQQVEGLRKDVRVVNLSLLNTGWYLKQLRDVEPTIDLDWDDEKITQIERFSGYMAALHAGYIQPSQMESFLRNYELRPYVRTLDEQLMTKDVAVARIVEREAGRRPLYIALTVPDLMGLETRLVQRGIVYQVAEPQGRDVRVDVDTTIRLLTEEYLYRGIIADGRPDTTVFKDDNSTKLVQNYAAAALAGAQSLLRQDRVTDAYRLAQFAGAVSPEATAVLYSLGILETEIGEYASAERRFRKLVEENRADPTIYGLLAQTLELQDRPSAAESTYLVAIERFPDDWETYRALFSLHWREGGDPQKAVGVLDTWIANHPNDENARRARQMWADSAAVRQAGTRGSGGDSLAPGR